ncbi:hypothetical protein C8Q80DRAFT_123683 [Daedaleopsis nitida]|nr:hypothetical protein C8Q80DRAFT_123683 [Daedaleopsis nitida]
MSSAMFSPHNATPSPRVPVEVAEDIINELQDDHPSLRNCALTCQAWLPRSRVHLFRTVHITNLAQSTSLRNILTLTSPSMLPQLIQSVDLEAVPGFRIKPKRTKCNFSISEILDTVSIVMLPLLPNLRNCIIRGTLQSNLGVYSSFRVRPISLACLRCFSTISKLSLIYVDIRCAADFLLLLDALPALRSLAVEHAAMRYSGSNWSSLLRRLSGKLRLQVLKIFHVRMPHNPAGDPFETLYRVLGDLTASVVEDLAIDMSQLVPHPYNEDIGEFDGYFRT